MAASMKATWKNPSLGIRTTTRAKNPVAVASAARTRCATARSGVANLWDMQTLGLERKGEREREREREKERETHFFLPAGLRSVKPQGAAKACEGGAYKRRKTRRSWRGREREMRGKAREGEREREREREIERCLL